MRENDADSRVTPGSVTVWIWVAIWVRATVRVVAEPLIVWVDFSKMVVGAKMVCRRVDPGTVTKKDDTTVTGGGAVAVDNGA